jgi:hypothetical protein
MDSSSKDITTTEDELSCLKIEMQALRDMIAANITHAVVNNRKRKTHVWIDGNRLPKLPRMVHQTEADKMARIRQAETILTENGLKLTNYNIRALGFSAVTVNKFRTKGIPNTQLNPEEQAEEDQHADLEAQVEEAAIRSEQGQPPLECSDDVVSL